MDYSICHEGVMSTRQAQRGVYYVMHAVMGVYTGLGLRVKRVMLIIVVSLFTRMSAVQCLRNLGSNLISSFPVGLFNANTELSILFVSTV